MRPSRRAAEGVQALRGQRRRRHGTQKGGSAGYQKAKWMISVPVP